MLPVAVEVAPANPPREQVVALLGACSRAVADADCVLAADLSEGGSQAVAIVTWQSDGRAFVEVGARREGKPEWRSRTVTFGAEDEPIERWRAVGFVVGTLARGEAPGEPEAKPAEPTPTSLPTAPESPAVEPPQRARAVPVVPRALGNEPGHPALAAVELGAVVGPGMDGLRTGGVLRTRWPLHEPLRSLFALRYVERPADDNGLRGQWLTVAAGAGAVLGTARAELGISLDARAEYFRASAEDAAGNQGSDSRWLPGFGLGISGAWMPTPAFGLYLGAESAWMLSQTTLKVARRSAGHDRALRAAVDAGIRVRLW